MLNYLQVLTHFRDKTCWVVKTELANHRYQLELLNLVDLNGKKKKYYNKYVRHNKTAYSY